VLSDSVFLAEGKPEGFALCFFQGSGFIHLRDGEKPQCQMKNGA